MPKSYQNPYKPGAAHTPPYLAGRDKDRKDFQHLLKQPEILENVILTGLRGVGKTVLLQDFFRADAIQNGWLWVENNMSESVSISEERLLTRLIADLSAKTGDWIVDEREIPAIGFAVKPETQTLRANYDFLSAYAAQTPGLPDDKLKAVLTLVWQLMRQQAADKRGIIFAYDEAQNMEDHANKGQYPLSMLLDVFSSLQRQGIPFMLVLTGLPPLQPKLVKARTFAERMFRVISLHNLDRAATSDAILKPLEKDAKPVHNYFRRINSAIYDMTAGYPYFIQHWCRELYDHVHSTPATKEGDIGIVDRIQRQLDGDFFDGRWMQLSNRQRDLLLAAATAYVDEFSVQGIVDACADLPFKRFSNSHANQMLTELIGKGMVFKNRHGKYVMAVPLLADYIRRCHSPK